MPISITRREWRTVLLIAALVIAATLLPYLVGLVLQSDAQQFSGAVIGADDFFSYIAKMRLGARGIWDFYLFYTPEPHDPVPLVFLAYILPGQIVGLFYGDHDPNLTSALVVTFHLMRVVFNLLLIVVLYRFIAHFLKSPRQRVTALLLALLGGGFGWLVIVVFGGDWLGSLPPEFFIPEGFSFLILLTLPHLALARMLLLAGLLALFRALAVERGGWRWALLAGVCWCVVGMIVPFYLAVLYCVLGAWGLALWIRGRRFPLALTLHGGLAAALTLPLFIYYALAFSRNPVFAAWSAQNILTSPHPLHYLFAYALFLALAAFAVRWAWRRGWRSPAYLLLLAWVLMMPLLVYLPINVQRRMAEGVIVPLAILAAHGLALLIRRLPKCRRRSVRTSGVIAFASLSNLLLLTGALTTIALPRPPLYIETDEVAAYAWLDANAPADSLVLSAFSTGNRLPAYTALRPYVGHGPETLDAPSKITETERFFANEMSDDERAALLTTYNIRYVIYGEQERALAADSAAAPTWTDGMTLVYDAGGYQVWTVDR
jgi:hypothetical protein